MRHSSSHGLLEDSNNRDKCYTLIDELVQAGDNGSVKNNVREKHFIQMNEIKI